MSVPELKDNPVGDGIINCADFETYHNEREEVRIHKIVEMAKEVRAFLTAFRVAQCGNL